MRKHSKETKEKIRQSHLGKKRDEATKKKISKTRLERKIVPWNKGLTQDDPRVKRNVEATTKAIIEGFKNGRKPHNWNGGKPKQKKFKYAKGWLKVSRAYKVLYPKCEICENKAQQVHHRDFGTADHSPDNLQSVCRKCHKVLHSQQ